MSARLASGRLASLLLMGTAMAAGCGDGDPPDPNHPVRTVLVVDDGIDESLPVFAGKIAASYTITCREQPAPDGGVSPDGGAGTSADGGSPSDATIEEARAELLAELARPDDECQLRPGIAAKTNPVADLEPERLAYNQAVRDDVNITTGKLRTLTEQIIDRLETSKAPYHGTATAGIIAHANPHVRLVLVERPLKSADQVMGEFTCLTQESIDLAVAVFSSPEVRQAYVERPPSAVDGALAEVMAATGVAVVNESFGRLSRFTLERLLVVKRCKQVALRPYFALMNELERAREDAHPGNALVVKAAGNDGVFTNGPDDSLDCRLGDQRRLSIGSYGFDYERSDFSNFGACIDAYAPGEFIAAPLPGDWLLPLHSGTSFAAPLVTRLVTAATPAFPADPVAARAAVLALRAPNRDIPVAQFPAQLLYDPRPKESKRSGQALTLEAPPRELPDRWLPSEPVMRQALWPIRWAQRRTKPQAGRAD